MAGHIPVICLPQPARFILRSLCINLVKLNNKQTFLDIQYARINIFLSPHHDIIKMFFVVVVFLNHYTQIGQANWCNITFTADNLFHSHSCIGWPKSSPDCDSNPYPDWEVDNLPTELFLTPNKGFNVCYTALDKWHQYDWLTHQVTLIYQCQLYTTSYEPSIYGCVQCIMS